MSEEHGHDERVLGKALGLFDGDLRAAERWLSTPKRALGVAVPSELAETEEGARAVEALIGRLEHGSSRDRGRDGVSEPPYEIATLAAIAAPGAVAGLAALVRVLRERRARARWLAEVRNLDEMLRLDDEAHSPVLRRHHEDRLDELIDGFDIRDYCRDPGVKEMVDAHFWRLKDAGDLG